MAGYQGRQFSNRVPFSQEPLARTKPVPGWWLAKLLEIERLQHEIELIKCNALDVKGHCRYRGIGEWSEHHGD